LKIILKNKREFMKRYLFFLFILGVLLNVSNTKRLGYKLNGSYVWQFTMTENELMLIKQKDTDEPYSASIKFKGNYSFTDNRNAKCGNDIFYTKKGRYYFSKSKLILNYTGGKFTDNVGGNTRQVYVLGKVYYTIAKMNADTIFLTKVKGDSEKKVSLTENIK
jgi:hypothetical protein